MTRFQAVRLAAGTKILVLDCRARKKGQVAQLVEQRTENPCVGGSIPPLATIIINYLAVIHLLSPKLW
jgi:hypothetical protein